MIQNQDLYWVSHVISSFVDEDCTNMETWTAIIMSRIWLQIHSRHDGDVDLVQTTCCDSFVGVSRWNDVHTQSPILAIRHDSHVSRVFYYNCTRWTKLTEIQLRPASTRINMWRTIM